MQKKILFCASVDRHFIAFHIPYLKYFKDNGWEVHVASAGEGEIPFCDRKYKVLFERSPFKIRNIIAYKTLKNIIEENRYSIIHCHTPVASVLTRFAAKNARKKYGTKVMYTAHGFHFYKGAPYINWLTFYPVEKWLSRYTDCLITINTEDYKNATKYHFSSPRIEKVHGVGVDLSKFSIINETEINELRKKHGFSETDFILIYPAELNRNKNQGLLIKIVANLKEKIPNIKLVLAGRGILTEDYCKMAKKMRVDDIVIFPGFVKNIDDFIKLSDISVASSLREGLPVNIMQGMACGKPIVATRNRGHNELIHDGINGYLIDFDDIGKASESILKLYNSQDLRRQMGIAGREMVIQYSLEAVMEEMSRIYRDFM